MFFIEKTYTDFNGNQRTEKFYFNLTTAECVEMMVSKAGGLDVYMERIIESNNMAEIVALVKELLLRAYGEKSPDGREFMKSKEISDRFAATNAYSDIYMELSYDAKKCADFFNRLIPDDLRQRVDQYMKDHPEDEKVKQLKAVTEE